MSVQEYGEAIYAGVLGKLIGVYLGRPVEGWAYEKIQEEFDELNYYVHRQVGVPLVVADDDISGTFGFFKVLEDNGYSPDISAQDVGNTWLNYIIEDKTILWWGGLGRSTEHTAYLRLKQGIPAPRSGSIKLNGTTLAQQIGAQIFIDAFAMMSPGDPDQAVSLIHKAASVSHDGLAVEAAGFLGAMEALAFDMQSLDELMNSALQYVSSGELLKLIDDVRSICARETDWRKVRAWLDPRYGYGVCPGPCHIIPNHAMVLASLLLGGDSFQRSIMIAASAGWDTDCNAGNVGCLNGIRLGLKGIESGADFRAEVADLMYVVTADGGSCVTDAVQQTQNILRAAAEFQGESTPHDDCRYSFKYRGSVQGFALCPYSNTGYPVASLSNLNDVSETRNGLLIRYDALAQGIPCCISTPVYLDFAEQSNNFSTVASPTLYSSQTVEATLETFESENPDIRFYILYYDVNNHVQRLYSSGFRLHKGINEVTWQVPDTNGMPIFRVGIELSSQTRLDGEIALRSMNWQNAPQRFVQEGMLMTSIWNLNPGWLQAWVSSAKQFAPDFKYTYCISHPDDEGVVTIGTQDWTDYSVSSKLSFSLHKAAGLVLRSKGHRRYYAAVVSGGSKVSIIIRHDSSVKELISAPFIYEQDRLYDFGFTANGSKLSIEIDGERTLEVEDENTEYTCGAAGFIVEQGTMLADGIVIARC